MEAPEQADSLQAAAAHPLVEALHAQLAAWDAPPASPRLVHLLAQCPTSFMRKAADGGGLPPPVHFPAHIVCTADGWRCKSHRAGARGGRGAPPGRRACAGAGRRGCAGAAAGSARDRGTVPRAGRLYVRPLPCLYTESVPASSSVLLGSINGARCVAGSGWAVHTSCSIRWTSPTSWCGLASYLLQPAWGATLHSCWVGILLSSLVARSLPAGVARHGSPAQPPRPRLSVTRPGAPAWSRPAPGRLACRPALTCQAGPPGAARRRGRLPARPLLAAVRPDRAHQPAPARLRPGRRCPPRPARAPRTQARAPTLRAPGRGRAGAARAPPLTHHACAPGRALAVKPPAGAPPGPRR